MGKEQKKKATQGKKSVQENYGNESDEVMIIDVSKYSAIGSPRFLVINNEDIHE